MHDYPKTNGLKQKLSFSSTHELRRKVVSKNTCRLSTKRETSRAFTSHKASRASHDLLPTTTSTTLFPFFPSLLNLPTRDLTAGLTDI